MLIGSEDGIVRRGRLGLGFWFRVLLVLGDAWMGCCECCCGGRRRNERRSFLVVGWGEVGSVVVAVVVAGCSSSECFVENRQQFDCLHTAVDVDELAAAELVAAASD